MPDWVGVDVGGLRIAVERPPGMSWVVPSTHFFVDELDAVPAWDVRFGVRVGRVGLPRRPRLGRGSERDRIEAVAVPGGWHLLHRRRGMIEREVHLDEALREGEIMLARDGQAARTGEPPLCWPLDEWLLRHRLAREGGVLLTACGVTRAGVATLFAAPPGAGKRALGQRLRTLPGCALLSDQRVAIRPDGTAFRAFGTPWSRSPATACERWARLDAVHRVVPGPVAARPLASAEAVAALVSVHSPCDALVLEQRSLATLERLAERVPVIRLSGAEEPGLAGLVWGPAWAPSPQSVRAPRGVRRSAARHAVL